MYQVVEIKKAERRRRNPETAQCYICREPILYERFAAGGRFTHRGVTCWVCEKCRGRYWRPVTQARKFGKRFPFIERTALPRKFYPAVSFTFRLPTGERIFSEIYHILFLAHERKLLRQKEVNWMIDDMTKKILKLPDKVARIVAQTVAVCGDDFKLSEDEALIRIRDLLEAIDPEIINRNKKKRLR